MFRDCRKPSPHFPTHHYTDAVSDNRSACLEVSQHRLYSRTSYSAPKHHPVTQHARGSGIKKLLADYILSRSFLANPSIRSRNIPQSQNYHKEEHHQQTNEQQYPGLSTYPFHFSAKTVRGKQNTKTVRASTMKQKIYLYYSYWKRKLVA